MAQQCGERVGRGTITWPCQLEINHPGPCYAVESTASAGDRRRWETEQGEKKRQAESGLDQFQGPAQTTAQRYTENPTPVPLSPGRRALHRDCQPWQCYVYDGDHGQRKSAQDECPRYDGSDTPATGHLESSVRTISPEAAGLPPGEYTATIDKGLPNEESVLVSDPREACGERYILGHGDAAVCRLAKGHEANHLDPNSSVGAYGWFEGLVDGRGMVPIGKSIPLPPPPTKTREGEFDYPAQARKLGEIASRGDFVEPTKQREETAVAWAAGLFEGEGCFSVTVGEKATNFRLTANLTSTDKDVLDRFVEVVQIGYTYGPYQKPGNRKPQFMWQTRNPDEFRELGALLVPYLMARRVARFQECLDIYDARPISNPAIWEGRRRVQEQSSDE